MLLVPTMLSFAVYWPTLGGFFQGDDLEGVWRATAFDPQMPGLGYPAIHWRPMTNLTLQVNHQIGGLDPLGFRLLNVVAHSAVAAMVGASFIVLTAWLERRRSTGLDYVAAMAVAAVFAVLPSHVEAVGWIAGRGDVLVTLFSLGSLAVFVLSLPAQRPSARSRSVSRLLVAVSLILLTCALLTKEAAIAVPFVATALLAAREWTPGLRRRWIRILRPALQATMPLYVVLMAWFVVRYAVLGSVLGGFGDATIGIGPVTLSRRWAAVLVRTVLPGAPVAIWLALAVVVLFALIWVWLAVSRSRFADALQQSDARSRPGFLLRPAVRTSAAFFVCAGICAVPAAALGVSMTSPAGERLTYLPSAFVALAVARIWSGLFGRRQAIALLAATAAIACGFVMTWHAALQWRAAADESERVVVALAVLPPDEPAVVVGARERTEDGIPVALNELGPAVVLFHGWTDPSSLTYGHPSPGGDVPTYRDRWRFDGQAFRPIGRR